ncbi:MAG TPA: sigma-70 family RNA polymerase sigma factor [Gemmatimonadales bacterium]|jgi:RNA polymerase sigma-70 factor (ECF subfamily)
MELADVFARHQGELFRYAARYTGDADLAEDVVQDTFVRLAERPPRRDDQLRGWLFRVATTIAIDAMRSAKRHIALVEATPEQVPFAGAAEDPAASIEREELRRKVRQGLAQLNDKERAVLLMREEGFAHREIAEAVGTTTGSIGTMYARALGKLAQRLDLDREDVP